ncbi:MAG: hypothetical protein R3242_01920 [Akkermansiaceae bacterium]|nr:hypothetical protein [Akkermansiaceae bacterium]
MIRFIHALLILAIGSVHAFGAYVTIEIRHSHGVAEGYLHGHVPAQQDDHEHHHGHDHSHDHDHHGHAPADDPTSPSDSQDGESNCPSHEHTHTKTLGGDAPLIIADLSKVASLRTASISKRSLSRDSCPGGPYYALVKPPQLG